ncbi:MAG: hypothetical protein KDD40_07195, partial [Bdellovibrionales bacterium]|nr:hypothetical protein [Bdellovibrionales bacterium]
NKNLVIYIILILNSGSGLAMNANKKVKNHDFTMSIKDARSEQKHLLESFQAELKEQPAATPEEAEVVEFLNSEIRWKSPQQNAKK